MAKVSTNINLDPELKKAGQQLFSDLGMDLTTAITIFIQQAVREQRIPFEITMIPNEKTLAAMDDAENGRNMYGPFDNISDLMEALNA